MENVCKFFKGRGISKEDLSDTGNPCILYGELYTTYKTAIAKTIKSRTLLDLKSLVHSKSNDVLIPCSGETAEDISTSICIPYNDVLIGGDLTIIRSQLNGAFLSNQINSVRKLDIARIAQGKSIVHLQADELKKINISFPTIDEQLKIATFVDLLDQRIDTQSKIIEKYESLIKVINQMMCNFDHEKIQVQNVFDFKEKTKHQANMGNSQGNFIYFTNEESTYKYFDSYDFDGEYIIANTGGKANFKYYNGKFAVMSDCLVMECNDNQNTKFYLYSILNRIDYINQVCFVGSGLKHLDKKLFLKTFITKFNKNLEPFINLIILLEKKISNNKILLQKLKEQKKYLLSNMFI